MTEEQKAALLKTHGSMVRLVIGRLKVIAAIVRIDGTDKVCWAASANGKGFASKKRATLSVFLGDVGIAKEQYNDSRGGTLHLFRPLSRDELEIYNKHLPESLALKKPSIDSQALVVMNNI